MGKFFVCALAADPLDLRFTGVRLGCSAQDWLQARAKYLERYPTHRSIALVQVKEVDEATARHFMPKQ